jgi:hypothetical protein
MGLRPSRPQTLRPVAPRRRGFLPHAAGAVVALSLWCTAAAASAGPAAVDEQYLGELIARAQTLQLAADPQWRALLHYQRAHLGAGVTSAAQGADFFTAPDGATNPQAELTATLRAFFDPQATRRNGEHPQCRFRARYAWLKGVLRFDPERLPEQPCPRFDEWREALRPAGMTLIFPEAYMNNPASMFGHTLLRVDRPAGPAAGVGSAGPLPDGSLDGAQSDSGTSDSLLAYAINFAADTGSDGGAVFAWKGILGYYPGFFSIRPYYEMVRTYGDWENRDIWEYQLNLSLPEIDMALLHLWELRGVAFAYYFFDENCSYQLLSLLDVARPDFHLMERVHRPWVIPVDTVRVVVAETGVVGQVRFRPSAATELRHRAGGLSPWQRRLARQIADGSLGPRAAALDELSPPQRAAVLGAAYGVLRYRYLEKDVGRAESAGRARAILVARSEIDVTGPVASPVPTPAVRPDEGHGTARVAVGTGWHDGRFYLDLRARGAFHSLLDPLGGYTAGAQVDFLDVAARLYPESSDLRVHDLTVIDIVSLSPADLFFRPISWKLNTGLQSRLVPGAGENPGHSGLSERYVWHSNGGAGLTGQLAANATVYGFLDASADVSTSLQPSYAVGPGLAAGAFVGPASDRWRAHLLARVTRFALGEASTASRMGLQTRLTLTRQTAVEASALYCRDFDRDWFEGGVSWHVFF